MKKLRVLVLLHPDLVPPEFARRARASKDINVWKTEYDVVSTLRGRRARGACRSASRTS